MKVKLIKPRSVQIYEDYLANRECSLYVDNDSFAISNEEFGLTMNGTINDSFEWNS